MARQKLIFVLIAFLTLGSLGGTLKPPRYIWTEPPSLRGLTDEQAKDAIEKWHADNILKERTADYEYRAEMTWQAIRKELQVSESQWRIIEPKFKRQFQLMKDAGARSSSRLKDPGIEWIKPTEYGLGMPRPPRFEELSEAYRNVEKLVDLLRREDTTDEELRKQMDALQQAREKARKEWPKAKQELAATLTTPRQEAVFLLLGNID